MTRFILIIIIVVVVVTVGITVVAVKGRETAICEQMFSFYKRWTFVIEDVCCLKTNSFISTVKKRVPCR